MKKFFSLIVLFISVVANGQIKEYRYTENVKFNDGTVRKVERMGRRLKIGDYTSQIEMFHKFFIPTETQNETYALADFIEENKERIEEKLGIVIDRSRKSDTIYKWVEIMGTSVNVIAYTKAEWEEKIAMERRAEEEPKRKAEATEKRLNSLTAIL